MLREDAAVQRLKGRTQPSPAWALLPQPCLRLGSCSHSPSTFVELFKNILWNCIYENLVVNIKILKYSMIESFNWDLSFWSLLLEQSVLNVSIKYLGKENEDLNLSNFLTVTVLSWRNSRTETILLDQWFLTCAFAIPTGAIC